jgi:hypothetical protein
MTSKEKAEQLTGKCFDIFVNDEEEHYSGTAWRIAKQCALIAVDEIIEEYGTYFKVNVEDKYVSYWEQVKQEIQKL